MNQRKLGVLVAYFTQGIHILSTLLYTPVMLRLLGRSEYGLYQLVGSVVSYMGLLSFGFSGAYVRFYSRLKQKEDNEGIARLNGMFMTIFLCIAAVCLLCGGVMVANIEHVFGSGLTAEEYPLARRLMILMVFNLAMTFPNSVFNAQTSAHEHFFFHKLLIALQYLLNPFLALPLLLMGYGSMGMACVTTFLTLSKFAANAYYCLRKLKVKFIFRDFQPEVLKEISGFTIFIFINMLVNQINWSVDKFLLGRIIGTTAVAIYGVGGQLNTLYMQLSSAISGVFTPRVNRIVARAGDCLQELSSLFIRVGRIQFVILSLVLTGYILFGHVFVPLWSGRGYEEAYLVGILLMLPVTIPSIQTLGVAIQRAMNMHRICSLVYLAVALANIGISIPLIAWKGAQGAALGTAITMLLGNGLFMNWYYSKKIGLSIGRFWKEILSFVPALVPPVAAGLLLRRFVLAESYASLILCILVYMMVFCASMWMLGLNRDEKKMVTSVIRRKSAKNA